MKGCLLELIHENLNRVKTLVQFDLKDYKICVWIGKKSTYLFEITTVINFIFELLLQYYDSIILESDMPRNTLYHKYNFVVWLEDMAHDGASSY